MAFPAFVDEAVNAAYDVLGDAARVADGATTLTGVVGIFRREWDQETSDVYQFSQEMPTWECRVDALAGLNLATVGSTLTVAFEGKTYAVQDLRNDSHVNVLLILSR